MTAVSQSQSSQSFSQHSFSSDIKSGHIFSDDELSEIFQIDFGLIFGNPEDGLKSNYKGIQHKKTPKGKLCGNGFNGVLLH
jgi:hypothetical protein